jgi:hypothetical protein
MLVNKDKPKCSPQKAPTVSTPANLLRTFLGLQSSSCAKMHLLNHQAAAGTAFVDVPAVCSQETVAPPTTSLLLRGNHQANVHQSMHSLCQNTQVANGTNALGNLTGLLRPISNYSPVGNTFELPVHMFTSAVELAGASSLFARPMHECCILPLL